VRRLADSALVWFLAFVAVLVVVTVLLARLPDDCGCWTRQAQVVLLPLGGLVALFGTVSVAHRRRSASGERLAVVLIGAGVVLVAVAQVLGLFAGG
jgi:hypothetical protein